MSIDFEKNFFFYIFSSAISSFVAVFSFLAGFLCESVLRFLNLMMAIVSEVRLNISAITPEMEMLTILKISQVSETKTVEVLITFSLPKQ